MIFPRRDAGGKMKCGRLSNFLIFRQALASPRDLYLRQGGLITHGSQQALGLVIRLLAGPGAKAVIEAPTYFNMIPLLRLNGMSIETVPMRKNGLDIPIS